VKKTSRALAIGAAYAVNAWAVPAIVQATARVPAPANTAYPGTIALAVDITDLDHHLFDVIERVPVQAGPLTLLYPEWLPGNHAPRGTIAGLGGLTITAGEKRLEWTRDSANVFAFHITVPAGVKEIEVRFQYASPVVHDQGRIVVTPEIVGLQWNSVVLYPAGHAQSRITFAPALTLPRGWDFGSALDVAQRTGEHVSFEPTSLEMLVDSPLFAGRYFKRLELTPVGSQRPVHLDIVADSPELLEIKPEQLAVHRKLVQEMYAVFGSQHYEHYDFLLALSDAFGGIGLEHHRSSENQQEPSYFTEWDKNATDRDLLAHEFSHSWNGKFRRPAGQYVLDFNTPLQNELLWVYEGMTQYYGHVLAARSGLWSEELARGIFAMSAANLDRNRPGRAWRDLQDTTNQPVVSPRRPLSFVSWQRTEEYYAEGELIWLDVDTRIRELTGGRRSLDDFAKGFYGVRDGAVGPVPYTFDDVVAGLNSVAANDWKAFLRARLAGHGPGAPLDGLARGGWKIAFTDTPSAYQKGYEELQKVIDLTHSLGLRVSTREAGSISEVTWDAPAFKAGLTMGGTIVAVNGVAFKGEVLKQAVKSARGGSTPIELIVKYGERYKVVRIPYYDGLRYPQLERLGGSEDRLGVILEPRT
jgi:predicted metalloprotease with PDZ domain